MDRAYIFNHSSFHLSDDTVFVVGVNGELSIENLRIIPEDDNFDFVSSGIAQYLNDLVLQPVIDPSKIGRKVLIHYTGNVLPSLYTQNAFASDVGRIAAWDGNAASAAAFIGANIHLLINALRDDGVFENHRGPRDIIYDGQQTNILTANGSSAILVGGFGEDHIQGSDGFDIIYGGPDDDSIVSSGGSDEIWGGNEKGKPELTDMDSVDYGNRSSGIEIIYSSDAAGAYVQVVKDGLGTDTLHSIERLTGSPQADTLKLTSLSGADDIDYIDLGGGTDVLDISGLPGSVTVDLRNVEDQTVQMTAGGDILHLRHVEAVKTGGGDDIVHGGEMLGSLSAGSGQDTLYLSSASGTRVDGTGGSVLLRAVGTFGFDGFEKVVGSDAPNLMYAAAGNHFVGGGGPNYIEGSGQGTKLESAAGDTYFSARDGATIISGAGNDYIEVEGTHPVTIVFGRGSGHDVLGSHYPGYFSDLSDPEWISDLNGGLALAMPSWTADRRNDTILFQGLGPDDLELLWDYQQYESEDARIGYAVIRIKDTGDTLALGVIYTGRNTVTDEFYMVVDWDREGGSSGPIYDFADKNDDSDEYGNTIDLKLFSFGGEKLSLLDIFDLRSIGPTSLDPSYYAAKGLLSGLSWSGGGPGDGAVLAGSGDADILAGGDGPDDVLGGAGNDTLSGGAGNDFVRGGTGDDTVLAGLGSDSEDGGGGRDTIDFGGTTAGIVVHLTSGTAQGPEIGIDTLSSFENATGGAGDDEIFGDDGDNVIAGGAGWDILAGADGADVLDGGAGYDRLEGGAGWDTFLWRPGDGTDLIVDQGDPYRANTLIIEGATLADFVVRRNPTTLDGALIFTATGETIFIGGMFAGTNSGIDEFLFRSDPASGGHTYEFHDLAALADDDTELRAPVVGSSGSDQLVGTSADDLMFGRGGDDSLQGGDGSDTLYGGAGDDGLAGGAGDDRYHYERGDGLDVIADISGDDVLAFGTAVVPGDVTVSREGDDLIFDISGGGQVRIVSGVDLDQAIENVTFADGTTWTRADVLARAGSSGDDTLTGTSGPDVLTGFGGADQLLGLEGSDVLDGGAGDDVLDGGADSDTLHAGRGDDLLIGGLGNDIYRFDAGDGNDAIREYEGTGPGGNDTVYLGPGILRLDTTIARSPDGLSYILFFGGGEESLTLYGMATGAPQYQVEQIRFAPFWIVYTGASLAFRARDVGNGDDILSGSEGTDIIRGLGGNDAIDGGAGTDWLRGDGGNDILTGGADADLFQFGPNDIGSQSDRITDFVSGEDRIDLAAIDADPADGADQAFSFIGSAPFSGTAGELRYVFDGTDTRVEGDLDGDCSPDFVLLLTGQKILSATDFVL
ncbi:MAG TPA: calcium-binding protein [Allosphingosinicella sp.]|jgi:Ca2+-binding RTX toxin-like protein